MRGTDWLAVATTGVVGFTGMSVAGALDIKTWSGEVVMVYICGLAVAMLLAGWAMWRYNKES
jgi:hypothetical protein